MLNIARSMEIGYSPFLRALPSALIFVFKKQKLFLGFDAHFSNEW